MLFKAPGPVLTQVNEWYRSAADTIGINPDYTNYLTNYIKAAGFIDVKETIYDIPIGEWPTTDRKYIIRLLKDSLKLIHHVFCLQGKNSMDICTRNK